MPMRRALLAAFDRGAAVIACGLVVALLTCVSLGVVTREFGAPLIWTDELSRFLMVWLAVFGWVLASRKRIHVRIRYFQNLLPRGAAEGCRGRHPARADAARRAHRVSERGPGDQEPRSRGHQPAAVDGVDVRADGARRRGHGRAGARGADGRRGACTLGVAVGEAEVE
jgi:hypothetical protein